MLFKQHAIALGSLLFELLTPTGELVFHLGQARLLFLFSGRRLLAALGQKLLAVLAGLLPHLHRLLFSLLSDGGGADQLIALPGGRSHHFLGPVTGLGNEFVTLTQQFDRLPQLCGQGFPHSVDHLDGILLIHQAPAAERHPRSIEQQILNLIDLIDHGDIGFSHGRMVFFPPD